MTKFSDELIHTWLEDGQRIREHYSTLILNEGLTSAKSLGERSKQRDFRVFDKLFEKVNICANYSILDVGCGNGELLDYLSSRFLDINKLNYLGIDIVPEFVSEAKRKFPLKKFQLINFIDTAFAPDNKFDIVLALGVLVTRVQQYELFFEYFLKKMLSCANKYVILNVISFIKPSSTNYSGLNEVGHSTVLDTEVLYSIINGISYCNCRVEPYNIFPDATDLFVYIQL